MAEVSKFPYSPFHGDSVKFHFGSHENHALDSLGLPKGSLGVFHFALASTRKPEEGKEEEYSVDSLAYFPSAFFSAASPLPELAANSKFKAGLADCLESFSKTQAGDLLLEAVLGLGKRDEFLSTDVVTVAAPLASLVSTHRLKKLVLVLRDFPRHHAELLLTNLLVLLCPDNRFKKDTKNEAFLEHVVVLHPDHAAMSGLPEKVKAVAESVHLTRDLVSAPPNYANTITLSEFLREKLTRLGLEVKVLDRAECEALGMFSYLSVGQGSKYPHRFLHATYRPGGPAAKKLVFVGKGIMFDSGGYNIKSSASSIHIMKFDMGGLSAVFGAANAVARLKPKNVEVHFVSAACENMVDANSYRPGDIVTASNGKTIEVLNTDAEGRLTLADALVYATKLDPDYIVDLATLTGAQMVALGVKCAAFYSNDDHLADLYSEAALSGGELAWRMPMLKEHKEYLKSKLADLANVNFNRYAGSMVGAMFLQEFVADKKWVHVDMAGPVWDYKAERGTGYGVLTLVNLVLNLSA